MTSAGGCGRARAAVRRALGSVVMVVGLVLVGCTGGGEGVDAAGTPSPAAGRSPRPAPEPGPVPMPGDCSALVPATRLVQALARPLPGPGAHIANGPQRGTGRSGRVTCVYGQAPANGPAPLEISFTGYDTPATAEGRVGATVERAAARGDAIRPQQVAGLPGFVIVGRLASSAVVSRERATLVVTIARGVVPDPALRPALVEVAEAVLAARPPPAGSPAAT